MPDQPTALIDLAREMLEQSYAPYSRFRVGAALLAGPELLFGGCNVENASYGLTVCAERVAVFRWAAAGQPGELIALAICARDASGREVPVRPCGACLQVVREFAVNPIIYLVAAEEIVEKRLEELLPEPFTPGPRS